MAIIGGRTRVRRMRHVSGQVMGGEAPVAQGMDAGDWRNQLPAISRRRIVNKIMEILKRHLPFAGHEGLQELKKMAVRFEEKNYASATRLLEKDIFEDAGNGDKNTESCVHFSSV